MPLRHYLLLPAFLLLIFSCGCETDLTTGEMATDTEPPAADTPADNSVTNAQALEALVLVNDIRTAGCTCGNEVMPPAPALTLHPQLQQAAERHSADQANNQHMSHQGSDGTRVGDRLTATGYNWRNAGENVAWNQRSVEQVVNAWKGSPGHCQNIMNPAYTFMGLAEEDWYWTQVLAR